MGEKYVKWEDGEEVVYEEGFFMDTKIGRLEKDDSIFAEKGEKNFVREDSFFGLPSGKVSAPDKDGGDRDYEFEGGFFRGEESGTFSGETDTRLDFTKSGWVEKRHYEKEKPEESKDDKSEEEIYDWSGGGYETFGGNTHALESDFYPGKSKSEKKNKNPRTKVQEREERELREREQIANMIDNMSGYEAQKNLVTPENSLAGKAAAMKIVVGKTSNLHSLIIMGENGQWGNAPQRRIEDLIKRDTRFREEYEEVQNLSQGELSNYLANSDYLKFRRRSQERLQAIMEPFEAQKRRNKALYPSSFWKFLKIICLGREKVAEAELRKQGYDSEGRKLEN